MATAVKEKPAKAESKPKSPPKANAAPAAAPVAEPATDAPGLPLEKVDGLRIEAKALAAAMKSAAAIVQSVAILPILANVRLLADGSTLEITTSDLDTEYRQTVPLKFECALAVTVDAKRLAAIAGSVAPEAVINMTAKDGKLSISSGRSRWQLPILPPDDFPILPAFTAQAEVEFPGADLAEAIARVDWSMHKGTAQPHLAGAYFHASNGKLAMAATTGSATLAVTHTAAPMADDVQPAMVPDKFLATLSTLAAAFDGKANLAWDDRKVRASIGDTILTGKLLDNSFPDYRRVIPAADASPVIFAPEGVLAALKRVNIVADERSRCVKMERADGALAISASGAGIGSAGEDIEADAAAGFESGINGELFAKMLTAIGGDTIEMHQANPQAAMLFRRVVDDGTLAIVMPMRL